jgi:hypothetical protein
MGANSCCSARRQYGAKPFLVEARGIVDPETVERAVRKVFVAAELRYTKLLICAHRET